MEQGIQKLNQHLPQQITSSLSETEKYFLSVGEMFTIAQYEKQKVVDKNSGFAGAELARYRIGKCMEDVYGIIGLQPDRWPSPNISKRLAQYVQNHYNYIAPQEIVDAVTFALQEKFPTMVNGKSILECYGNMDLIWIKNMLDAYVKFRYEKKILLSSKIEKEMSKPAMLSTEQIIARRTKSDQAVKEIVRDCYKLWLEKTEYNPWEPLLSNYFLWLVDLELVAYDKTWLNNKLKSVADNNPKWKLSACKERVKVLAVLNAFETWALSEDPLKIFNEVCYVESLDKE